MSEPGLTLFAYEPLTEQGLYSREFVGNLTDNHDGYKHVISVIGGYDTAGFTLRGDIDFLKGWYEDGLMRRVVLYNPEGLISWEGYVSRLSLSFGSLERSKTIESMWNRIYYQFTPIDVANDPPSPSEVQLLVFDKTSTQTKYGVRATVIKGGERTHRDAFDHARTFLDIHDEPTEGEKVSTTSKKEPVLKIECKGYYHTLKWIPFISSTTGEVSADQVIREVLTYFNGINGGWLSMNFDFLDYNFRTERRSGDTFETCWKVLKGIINRGGNGGERWVGGIYQNRQFDYKPAEDFNQMYGEESFLFRSLADSSQRIFDEINQVEIKPWDMLPDRVLRTVDL